MTDKHPYVPAKGNLVPVINHFRKSLPSTVNANTLKKLGFAPKNESYVLSVLRWLELIDDQGKPTTLATKIFNLHEDEDFRKQLGAAVKKAYTDLFEAHGEKSWALDQDGLITFFRTTDQSSAIVGKRQANTFQLLAAFSGHGDVPKAKTPAKQGAKSTKKQVGRAKKPPSRTLSNVASADSKGEVSNVGLTVRIEVNLPADADQETYDRIFRSIRENLLND